jgi:hypothetical protein
MKLSDLLKPKQSITDAYAPGGFFNPGDSSLSGMLQNSINKSSPGFKATTTTQAGTPVATTQKQTSPMPANTPAAARSDLQGFDYYSNLAQNAERPETRTAANEWLKRNLIDDTQQMVDTTDTESMQNDFGSGSDIDFSTPTSQVAYSAEKLNELFGTKSPEDLFAMREQLRRDAALARAGLLPEEEYMQYQGLPGMKGERGYSFEDTMALNRATADIFSNAATKADRAITQAGLDAKTQASAGGLDTSGVPQQYASIINSSSLGKTADERAVNRQDLVRAALEGDDAFIAALIGKGEPALEGEARKAFDQRITNAEQLDSFITAVEGGTIKLGNIERIKQSAFNKFGAQSPEYAMANFLSGGVSAQERNRLFGASLTGTEKEDAARFIITPEDKPELAIQKAKAMKATMTYANDLSALTRSGATRAEISRWQKEGRMRSLNDYLLEFGIPQDSPIIKKPNINDDSISYTERQILKSNGLTDDQIDSEFGFKKVGSVTKQAPKVVAGYDISSYATDPLHETKVAKIYEKTPPFKTASDIDMVIRQVAPRSKITGQMVATAANTYGVDPKMVYAIMLQDSSLGTAGMGARNNNPGNIGQFDHLGQPVAGYRTMQDGVNAVAKWLSKKRVADQKQYT